MSCDAHTIHSKPTAEPIRGVQICFNRLKIVYQYLTSFHRRSWIAFEDWKLSHLLLRRYYAKTPTLSKTSVWGLSVGRTMTGLTRWHNVDDELGVLFPLDCQMAPWCTVPFHKSRLFSGAQETSCSLGRHCRAELTKEVVRLRMFLIMDEIREYWTVWFIDVYCQQKPMLAFGRFPFL